jgi:O-antigen/teichoic acid export membrane protein
MSSISARYVAMLKTTDTVRLGRILSFSLIFSSFSIVVMSGLCFILSGVISNSLYKSPDLQSTLAFASLNLLFWISNDCLQGILLGFEDFKRVSIIEVVKSLLFFGAAIPLSVVFRINGIVFAQIISLIVSFIFYLVFFGSLLRKYQIKLAFKNSLQAKKIIWDFGLPNLLSTLLTGPAQTFTDSLAVTSHAGFFGMGGYNAAARWRAIVSFIPENIRKITFPILARLRAEGNKAKFIKTMVASLFFNGGLTTLIAVPVIVFSPLILSFYGKEYINDWDVMSILIASSVLQAINDVVTQTTTIYKKMWWNLAFYVVWAGVLVGSAIIFIPAFGIRGYALSVLSSIVVYMTINIIAAFTWIKKDKFIKAA